MNISDWYKVSEAQEGILNTKLFGLDEPEIAECDAGRDPVKSNEPLDVPDEPVVGVSARIHGRRMLPKRLEDYEVGILTGVAPVSYKEAMVSGEAAQ